MKHKPADIIQDLQNFGEYGGVNPSIAGDRDKILTIGINILEWPSSIKINVFVIA